MPSFNSQSQKNHGIYWPGIIRTLIVQVLVLFAVSVAVVRYANWASDAAQAEFIGTIKPSAPAPTHSQQSSTPVQTVNGRTTCSRSA